MADGKNANESDTTGKPRPPARPILDEALEGGYRAPGAPPAGAPAPSVLSVVKRGLEGSEQDYRYSWATFGSNPCFRPALLWGIGLGALFGVHRFKETREQESDGEVKGQGATSESLAGLLSPP